MASKYKIDDSLFIQYVKESLCIREVLQKCGIAAKGGNYRIFYSRVKQLNLDTSHFTGRGHLKGKKHSWAAEFSIEKSFVEKGSLTTTKLKAKILKYKLKEYLCVKCGLTKWQGQPISLHLDHINGDSFDNRLENLRFLCPNCHSQTSNYCRKKCSLN